MSLLHFVHGKFELSPGTPVEIYSCPANKSHAYIDVSFFKQIKDQDGMCRISLSSKSNPSELNSVDYFIDDVEMLGTVDQNELSKIVVGKGQRLHVEVIYGPKCNIRVTGMEENNPLVLNAGRLAGSAVVGTAKTTVFVNDAPNAVYTSCALTVYNSSSSEPADIECWITSNKDALEADKVASLTLPPEDTAIFENLILAPNEKLVFRSSQSLSEYFVNGVVMGPTNVTVP